MTEQNQQNSFNFITPELTHRVELILHLLEYSNHLVVVKGEHESGKSTLCEELTQQEESNLIIRKLTVNTHTNANDIFKIIIEGDIDDDMEETVFSQDDVNQWLVRCQNKQQIPALLIDNVDLFSDELINNLFDILTASNEDAVFHVCLFCEPSFLDRLEETGINSDNSRSLHIIDMPDLSEKQTEQYIHSKYPTDGTSELSLFDEKSIKQIHRISHGMPGRINALCEQYLDDPAKVAEVTDEKPAINISAILLKNKSILFVVVILVFLSVGVSTLLHETGKEVEKQTIKLDLPEKNKGKTEQVEITNIDTAQDPDPEPEPITIEELSPPVIPEIANDLNGTSEVIVYNAEGQIVAKESELETQTVYAGIKEEIMPLIDTVTDTENIIEDLPEPVKVAEPPAEPVKEDINWLIKQDPKKYVLQLIGAYEKETIDLYLKSFKNNDNKIVSFTASNKGREWHVLVYGLYENRDQAVSAIEELPTKAKLMAPWPRTVESIKDLLN